MTADSAALDLPSSLSTLESHADLLFASSGNYLYLRDSSRLITLYDYATSTSGGINDRTYESVETV